MVEEEGLLYFDVGFGEKFVFFVLPVWRYFSLNALSGFMSVEVFFETVRRFVEVKPPKGYRARFIIFDSHERGYNVLKNHLNFTGYERVLILINLKDLGLGNEKVVINGLSSKLIYRIVKTLRENGLITGIINLKEGALSEEIKGVNLLEFVSYPNNFKDRLTRQMYDIRRRDFGVTLTMLILDSVLKYEMV